jgi:hypothetical protein
MRVPTARSIIALSVALAAAAPVSAQGRLTVRTLEQGDWSAAVAALQTDLRSQGHVVHVVVEDESGRRAACGEYQIMLDDAGSRAFDVVACDGASSATALRLDDRMALFEPGDVVAHPRAIGIAAMETRHGSALGGASLRAETELRCSIAVRPYLVDYATGARVPARPDRFELRPIGDGAVVEARGEGWTIRSGSVRLDYELVDRQSGDVVLREAVALSCGEPTLASATVTPAADAIELHPGRVYRGATMTRELSDDHGSCGGQEGPEEWYVVRLDAPAHLGLRLVSEFDAALYVRAGSQQGGEIACRDDYAQLETLDINLDPGVYYVAVDGTGTNGRYRLITFEDPIDPRALTPVPRDRIANHESLDGELVPAVSSYQASCGGAEAPEHVYWFRLDRPSFVSVRLESRFDSALYLLASSGSELRCQSVMGFVGDTRESSVTAELRPGLYYVVVDGENDRAVAGRYHVALHELPLP